MPAFGRGAAVEIDLAGHDERLRPFARLDQAAPHEELIEAELHRRTGGYEERWTIHWAMASRCEGRRPASARAASARAVVSAAIRFDASRP